MPYIVDIEFHADDDALKKANEHAESLNKTFKELYTQYTQLKKAGNLKESGGLFEALFDDAKKGLLWSALFEEKKRELRELLKDSKKDVSEYIVYLDEVTGHSINQIDLVQKTIDLRKVGASFEEIPQMIATSTRTASNSTKEIDQFSKAWEDLLSSFGNTKPAVKTVTLGLLAIRGGVEGIKFAVTENSAEFQTNFKGIFNNARSLFSSSENQFQGFFPRMLSPREANFPRPITTNNYRNQQQESSQPIDPRTLPNAEMEKLPVKTASEVATKLYTQMKDTKLVTVEVSKGLAQVGQQGGKSFIELINLSGKLKSTLASGLDQVSQKIQQGVHAKLVEAFNGAHSVAQQFFADVLSQLAAVAAKAGSGAIIAGLLSVIPGVGTFAGLFKSLTGFAGGGIIPEPVLGVGLRSGTGYTFGEQGPEYVMPNSQLQSARFSSNGSNQLAQRIAGLEKAIAGGTWRISGRDIVYSYDRNSYGVNQRRF